MVEKPLICVSKTMFDDIEKTEMYIDKQILKIGSDKVNQVFKAKKPFFPHIEPTLSDGPYSIRPLKHFSCWAPIAPRAYWIRPNLLGS